MAELRFLDSDEIELRYADEAARDPLVNTETHVRSTPHTGEIEDAAGEWRGGSVTRPARSARGFRPSLP